jgi:hypothetical protein
MEPAKRSVSYLIAIARPPTPSISAWHGEKNPAKGIFKPTDGQLAKLEH